MEQIRTFEKENSISFSNRKALIQFVSKYFAFLYQEHCEYRKVYTLGEPKERAFWEERIKKEVPVLEKTIKDLLETTRYFGRTMKITTKSVFLKEAFKKAKISSSPKNYIPCNVEYEINGLEFKQNVR